MEKFGNNLVLFPFFYDKNVKIVAKKCVKSV